MTFHLAKKNVGTWEKCIGCNGKRHEEVVMLPCLYCKKPLHYALTEPEANGTFNSYCSNGECEDKHAATL